MRPRNRLVEEDHYEVKREFSSFGEERWRQFVDVGRWVEGGRPGLCASAPGSSAIDACSVPAASLPPVSGLRRRPRTVGLPCTARLRALQKVGPPQRDLSGSGA